MSSLTNHLALLGINQHHIIACKAPAQSEAIELRSAQPDIFGRPQLMTPTTLRCWEDMASQANSESIKLQLVSAYRSIEYQCKLIKTKLESGRCINEILKFNAIPGYSEHHTGQALDLTTPGYDTLEENFEESEAFSWLTTNASYFHFRMSYPRHNDLGINYEPWHWFCEKG